MQKQRPTLDVRRFDIDITETDFQASQGARAAKLATSAPSSRSEREALGHEIRSMDYK